MINGKKVVALIQARASSTRLPMKHFRYIGNKRLIDWIVFRLKKLDEIDEIIISTSDETSNQAFKEYADEAGIECYLYKGSVDDVVSRHCNASKASNADYVLVISGDCPLIDKDIIRTQLNMIDSGYDACKAKRHCIHEGINAYSKKAMDFLEKFSKTEYEREHFGVIMKDHTEDLKVGELDIEDRHAQNIFRISIDTMADMRFMNEIYRRLEKRQLQFNLDNVIDEVAKDPEVLNKIAHVNQKRADEKTYRFIIRTEASNEIGLGHIKRMMALGRYLNEDKNNGVFYAINNDNYAEEILKSRGYEYDYRCVENEKLIELINEYNADALIVDVKTLNGDLEYDFENIKKCTGLKSVILIDKYTENKFVDLMIIPGVQSDEFKRTIEGKKNVLSGIETVFVGGEFREVQRSITDQIVISFGGTDINNMTTKMIKAINDMNISKDNRFKIILGPYFSHIEELEIELKKFKYGFEIVRNPENMAAEIKDCKLGIGYYGVGFYEFKFLGIPTVDIVSDHIYDEEFKTLSSMGIGNYCGTKEDIDFKKIEGCINGEGLKIKKINISDMEMVYSRIVEVF